MCRHLPSCANWDLFISTSSYTNIYLFSLDTCVRRRLYFLCVTVQPVSCRVTSNGDKRHSLNHTAPTDAGPLWMADRIHISIPGLFEMTNVNLFYTRYILFNCVTNTYDHIPETQTHEYRRMFTGRTCASNDALVMGLTIRVMDVLYSFVDTT